MDFKEGWLLIKKVFPILDESYNLCQLCDLLFLKQEFCEAIEFIKKIGLAVHIQNLIVSKIEQRLRDEVAPEFWSYFKNNEHENKGFKQFYNAVKSLYDSYRILDNTMRKIEMLRNAAEIEEQIYNEKNVSDALKLILKATLLSQLHADYSSVVVNFYEAALRMEDVDECSDGQCIICSQESLHCNCLHLFQETNRKLGEMTLLEPLVGHSLTNLIYDYIISHIQRICKDSFDSSFIGVLEKWLQDIVLNWLRNIYCHDASRSIAESMNTFEKKLVNVLYKSYTKIRIDQLFNIIIEYPESLPALEDLRVCLPRTDMKGMLTKKLQKAMETRLLHPGVSTPDVLTAYVAAIRSLRILDPTGLLLETVTAPVHQYLRSREDTVRCVVTSLTEEGPNDLAEELVRGEAVQVDENTPLDEDNEDWENWIPDPIDAVPSKLPTRRTSDIISMLVNVYGSKELFVNEYRTLLANRLLTQCLCDTEKEIRYLELLKLRFGDSQLHYCEVMLKDVADSKRINQHIKQDPEYTEEDISISAMIVSAQFWPAFKEEKLELHTKVQSQIAKYITGFETLKGSRTLCWKNHLGFVDLEIELADRTLTLSVSTVHATIIMHFQDKNTWELEELSKVMLCPATVLRRKIGFWQSHGIIVETNPDVFSIQEDLENKESNIPQEDIFVDDYEAESAMASAQDQREEELQTFWSYIVGMLMNLDTLPLERIHQMLKMFAFQGPTIECNIQELKVFLDRKVREHHLIYSNGYYKLPK